MNRSLWLAVGIVSLVMIISSLLPLDGGGLHAEESARLWTDHASGGSLWDRVAPFLGTDLGPLSWSLLGLAAVLAVILVVRVRRRALSGEHRQARRLARRGRPVAEIARRMKLSQDAVRILLEPGPSRRTGPSAFGRIFRAARFSPAGAGSRPGDDTGQPAGI
jgi:hypothetical protein